MKAVERAENTPEAIIARGKQETFARDGMFARLNFSSAELNTSPDGAKNHR